MAADFRRLDAYRCALEFFAIAVPLAERAPPAFADLGDQLRRASSSILLNIAEGVGKGSPADKRRYFLAARGSAMECLAVLDILAVLRAAELATIDGGCGLLERIISMLSRLAGFNKHPPAPT